MHWCESKKILLGEMELQDCNPNYSKICGQMYKRLQKEHLHLQRSFLTVYQTLNESLSKSQGIEEYVSNISESIKSDEFDSFTNITLTNPKLEKSQIHETEPLQSCIPVVVYKKLSKEHLTLQRSFTSVCHSLREALDKSQRPKQQKKYNKDSDELKREIELLKLELQESRDQNELFEFRIHELEQIKEIACIKCCKLESQLLDTNNENQKLSEKFNASKRVLNDLIVKYGLKEELQNLLLHKNYNKIDAIDRNRYLCSAMTSEDEGLGDDSRRDHSSGPSSLVDMQECEYDVISEKSSQSNAENDSNPTLKKSVCLQTDSLLSECQNFISELNKNKDLIEKLEKSLIQMKSEKANLEEQVLELEEAENDARLVSQQLQQQLKTFVDQYETIQLDLINANKTIDLNNNRIDSFEKIESELRAQLEDIRSILLKQSLIDSNSYRNEHNFLDETNKKYLVARLCISDKEDIIPDQCKPPIDSLYTFLWEKLYRIETQIDCLQQSYCHSLETFGSHESDEDLQLFISAENLSEEVSKIGSSFEVSQFHNKYGQSYGQSETRHEHSISSTPLCETVKPEKIDISLDNYWRSKASLSTHCFPPEITDKVYNLESNEQNLRQRLVQLEWINKEFIKELEIRERVFFQRESHQKEWLSTENEFKHSINEYQSQLNFFRIEGKEIRDQINSLNVKFITITEENEEKRTENNLDSNHENNCVISIEKLLKELEFKFNDYLSRMQSLEDIDRQNSLNKTEKNQDLIKELKKCRQIFFEMKDYFLGKKFHFIDCYNCPKTEIQDIESEKAILNKKLIEISEKEIILETSLNQKENEWRKGRQTYEAKIESLDDEHKRVEKGLRLRMKEMECQTSTTVNELEMERNQIIKQLNEYFSKIQSNEFEYRKELNKLNENVNKIEAKISKLVDFESNFEKLNVEKLKLKIEINSVQSSEEQLKKKLNEMIEKEAAYKETLSKADKIIGSLEHNYKQRIDELEASEVKLKTRITHLEDTESRLRSNLRTERRTSDSYGKASDLVQQLIDSEARESTLKQQIKGLELRINELEQNLDEINQTKSRIESELKDQDELVCNVHQLQQQIESLKKDLNKSLQSQDSIQNMLKETEKYYQQRDEEMQTKYKSLEDEKCNLELTIQHLKHCLRHSQSTTHSFTSCSNNNSMELKIIQDTFGSNEIQLPKNTGSVDENFESKSKAIKNEDFDQTFLNVEKCLKRAMAVITLEIRQKDIEDKSDNCVVAVTEKSSTSLQSVKNIKDFKVSVQTKNSCSPKSSKSLSSKWSGIKRPSAPKNFKILKKVSSDSLLIGWQTNKEENISGYQILVNEVLVKRVQNPNTTKSLVRKLDLNKSFEMKIKSISCCGQLSEEVVMEYLPIFWIQPTPAMESTDYSSYSSDSSDSSESSANQITRL